jgi:hypothetical protein
VVLKGVSHGIWEVFFASKLQKFISKDQNQMVSGIKGGISCDLGSLFASKHQQKFMTKDQNPDGKWD